MWTTRWGQDGERISNSISTTPFEISLDLSNLSGTRPRRNHSTAFWKNYSAASVEFHDSLDHRFQFTVNHSTTYRHLSPMSYSTQFHSSSSLYSTVSLRRSPSLCSHHTRPSLRCQNRVPRLVHRRRLKNYSVTNARVDHQIVVPSSPILTRRRSTRSQIFTWPQVFTRPPATEPLNFTDILLDRRSSTRPLVLDLSPIQSKPLYSTRERETWKGLRLLEYLIVLVRLGLYCLLLTILALLFSLKLTYWYWNFDF